MKTQKCKMRQKRCSCIHRCNNKSSLKGGIRMHHNTADSLWNCLSQRLAEIGLIPHDVGGYGDCFFKSVSHQLYGTADLHVEVRMAGISHLHNYQELYIESISDDTWENYIKQMSKPGTWCDHLIIQAVANAFNCVIHITESNANSLQTTIITPVLQQEIQQTIFIGYINDLLYVSTVTHSNSQLRNRLKYLKRKYSVSEYDKEKKFEKRRANYKKQLSEESAEKKQERLAKMRASYNKRCSEETAEKKQERLAKRRANYKKQASQQPVKERQEKLINTPIHEQTQAKSNIDMFHKSNIYTVYQCSVCREAWPIKFRPKIANQYQCSRCTNDKQQLKKFSKENDMIPSLVPSQLAGLTQVEEMLIARALPIMRVYIKPGGQRGYSGHCINLPQNEATEPDLGSQNEEDIVYNESTEMSSFLPIPECQQQEVQAIQQQLCHQPTHMPWPTADNEPLNEYLTPFLATLAFPALFPDGKGDPTNPLLHRDVHLAERVKHLLRFGENIDGKWLYRFASHPRFAYWALNMIQRKRILQQTGIFLKQNPGEAHLSVEELQQMAADNNTNVFVSKLSRYLSNITGSNAYWHKAKEDLKAIISHVGAPTFFFTFSSADMHWPDLHALFSSSLSDTTPESKRQNVINNPHITDWFFTQRLENFIKHWLYNSLDAEWHWYRFEYQARGSIPCHGVAKLKNDPGLCQLSETALKGYLAEVSLNKAEQSDILELNKQILEGKKASQTVCEYVDWLLSTYNPDPPEDGFWIKPSIHPCQRQHKDIMNTQQSDDDYVDLLNTVQRRTRCSTNYCLRKKQNETNVKCRFNFPFQPCTSTKLEFEQIHTKDGSPKYKAKVITKRNDGRLNNHQHLQLQGWRANCDIQVVIDYHACVEYLAKYASKGEPRSPVLKQAFNSIMHSCKNNSNPTKLIKKVIMKSLGQRDFSAQETMHHLMSLKLVSSSFNVVPISLNGSRRINTNSFDDTLVTNESLLDVYPNREKYAQTNPNIVMLNFVSFASKYKLVNKKLTSQPQSTVPIVFPVFSSNPKGQNFGLYCKYQLLRYKLWQTTQENAWDDQPGSDDIYITSWKAFLQTQYAKQHVPDWHEKLQTLESLSENDTDCENISQQLPQREEWMHLADLIPESFVNTTEETLQPDCNNYQSLLTLSTTVRKKSFQFLRLQTLHQNSLLLLRDTWLT